MRIRIVREPGLHGLHDSGPLVAGQAGPLQQRLEELVGDTGLQGFVVGCWAEASQHLHNLVQRLAEAWVLHQGRMTGVPTMDGTLSTILS